MIKCRHVFFIFFFFSLHAVTLQETENQQKSSKLKSIRELGNTAIELALNNEWKGSAKIYTTLLEAQLPDWQKQLVLYNLATLHLHDKQPDIALSLFDSIILSQVANPWTLRSIAFNQSVAYFDQATRLLNPRDIDLKEQLMNYEKSQEALKEAQKLNCLFENFSPSSVISCKKVFEGALNSLTLLADRNRTRQRQQLLSIYPLPIGLIVLSHGLKRWGEVAENFTEISLLPDQKELSFAFLLQEAKSLQPIWESLKSMSIMQEPFFAFSQGVDLLTKFDLNQAKQSFLSSLKSIKKIKKAEGIFSLENLSTHYEWLLVGDYSLSELNVLISQNEHLLPESLEAQEILNSLRQSLSHLKKGKKDLSTFFLLQAFVSFRRLNIEAEKDKISPSMDLKEALLSAWYSHELLNMFDKLKEKPSNSLKILEAAQMDVIKKGQQFFQNALKFQRQAFEGEKSQVSRCQKFPWQNVLAVFDQGNKAAYHVFEEASLHLKSKKQQETLFYWKKALKALSEQENSMKTEQPLENQNKTQEIFQALEEMESQDRMLLKKAPSSSEGSRW